MSYRSDSSVADLLQCFFTQCEHHFRFLERTHGFSYISGMADYKDHYKIISPYHSQKISGRFLAITRYERGPQAFEFLFGEDHFILEGYVYYDPVRRFELSEILAAAKKNENDIAGSFGLVKTDLIENNLRKMAETLHRHIDYYVKEDKKLLGRAAIIRDKRIEQVVRKHFQDQINDACKYAAKAFVQKNYRQVVTVLQPLERYLAASDLKKLNLARKHLQS